MAPNKLNVMAMNEPMIYYLNQHIYESGVYPINDDGHDCSNDWILKQTYIWLSNYSKYILYVYSILMFFYLLHIMGVPSWLPMIFSWLLHKWLVIYFSL